MWVESGVPATLVLVVTNGKAPIPEDESLGWMNSAVKKTAFLLIRNPIRRVRENLPGRFDAQAAGIRPPLLVKPENVRFDD